MIMSMKNFTIKGPIHLRDPQASEFDFPGIYVWGFLYDKKTEKPCDFSESKSLIYDKKNHQFVPYYVGLSTHSVKDRLLQHSLIRSMHSAKIIRFSMDFMSKFFKYVPDQNGSNVSYLNQHQQICQKFKSSINYYNSHDLMNQVYRDSDYSVEINAVFNRGKEPGIAEFDFVEHIDTLNILINERNNFFTLYIQVNNFQNGLRDLNTKLRDLNTKLKSERNALKALKKLKKKIRKKDSNLEKSDVHNAKKLEDKTNQIADQISVLEKKISVIEKEKKVLLESLEKKVYLSLKGGTVSRYTKSRKSNEYEVEDNTFTGVFKLKENSNLLEEWKAGERKVDLSQNPVICRVGYFTPSHTSP